MALKVLSLFSGIGAFEKALKNLNIDYELTNYCEIDKYASLAYSKIHNVGEELNLGDVSKVDTLELDDDIDLITHGSPCQDFSLAGKQAGGDKDSGTRSSLMYETLRIVGDVKPKIVIWENVKNVVSKKHIHNFDAYRSALIDLGYNSYYQVLNAKHYGIPQNRERIFVISIRKDIDNGEFKFPEPFELKLRLKDLLEDKVDEKYYLSTKKINSIANWKAYQKPFEKVQGQNSVCPTLTARGAGEEHSGMITYCDSLDDTTNLQEYCLNIKDRVIEEILKDTNYGRGFGSKGKVQDENGVCDTLLSAMGSGGGNTPIICEQRYDEGLRFFKDNVCGSLRTIDSCGDKRVIEVPKEESLWTDLQSQMITDDGNVKRYVNSKVVDKFEEGQAADISFPNGYNKANRVHDSMPSLNVTTTKNSFVYKESQSPLRIRKLTPRECYRLMGFGDEDFDKVDGIISNTQLYKTAGNSIVVNVLVEIYKELQKVLPDLFKTK